MKCRVNGAGKLIFCLFSLLSLSSPAIRRTIYLAEILESEASLSKLYLLLLTEENMFMLSNAKLQLLLDLKGVSLLQLS